MALNNKYLKFMYAVLFLLGAMMAEAENNTMTYADPAKTIQVGSQNPEFSLKLRSNATTGYSWLLLPDASGLIVPVKHQYVAPKTDRIGAGGYELWIFKLAPAAFIVPTVLKLSMVYAQPWNLQNTKPVEFTISTFANA